MRMDSGTLEWIQLGERALLLGVIFMLALGCGPALAQVHDIPEIHSVTVTPLALPGDTMHVVVNVSDTLNNLTHVQANGTQLTPTVNNNWEGDFLANPALGVYPIDVFAEDANGNTAQQSAATSYRTTTLVGGASRSLLDPVATLLSSHYIFRTWGKARFVDANTFKITDGGIFPVTVSSPGHDVADEDYVVARGILDTQNAPPALLRNAAYTIMSMGPRKPITLYDVSVGKDLQVSGSGYLPTTVPYGGSLDVTLRSTDPSRVLLTTDAGTVGTSSIVLTVPGGSSSTPTFYVQGLASSGAVDVIATAPGGLGKTMKVTLYPSGFCLDSGSISTTSFSANTNVSVRPAVLSPSTMTFITWGYLRAGAPTVSVPVTCSDETVGTITVSPLTFGALDTTVKTQFDPLGAGTATISIAAPTGFSTPTDKQSTTATVTAPDVIGWNTNVGLDLVKQGSCCLETSPPSPVNVTIEVDDPSIATVSFYAGDLGDKSIAYTSIANTGYLSYWIQGKRVGTTTLRISAPGYTACAKTVTVDPSGFCLYTGSFSTTSFSPNSNVTVRPARLSPDTMKWAEWGKLRAGIQDVSVPVSISDTSAGAIATSPLTFTALTDSLTTQFDPLAAGTPVISIAAPAGFSTPADKQSITLTVTAPDVVTWDNRVGRDMVKQASCYLQVTPPSPTDVKIEVGDESIASVSFNAADEGGKSVTFTSIQSTGYINCWLQGRSIGSTTLTVSAPGYNTCTRTIFVDPSGFCLSSGNIATTTFSPDMFVEVRPARLSPDTLRWAEWAKLRAGVDSVSLDVVSSDTAVGKITSSPLVYNALSDTASIAFDPIDVGTSVISISTPDGFATPTDKQSVTATISVPAITSRDTVVGRELVWQNICYLQVEPPNPVDVSLEVENESIATVSFYAGDLGGKSITYPNIQSMDFLYYWVQGRSIGATTLTIRATGYAPRTVTITVDPSGFMIYRPNSISVQSTSVGAGVTVVPARLDPTTFRYVEWGKLRGGVDPITVEVVSSNWSIGTILRSPIHFSTNSVGAAVFAPAGTGTCTVSVVAPPGFSVPSEKREITATVTP